MRKRTKKYIVYVVTKERFEEIVEATSKKKALEKFYEENYLDGEIIEESVEVDE